MYDPVIGRWHVPDNVANLAPSWSPYRYAFNNPLKYVDIDGNFELNNAKKYPRLAEYLKNSVRGVLSNSRFKRGLGGYGQTPYSQIAEDVKWGQGPKIVVVKDLKSSQGLYCMGLFKRDAAPNTIYLDEDFVNKLENASREDAEAMLLWVSGIMFHEYVHLGDWRHDGKAHDYEAGDAFEDFVYGRQLDSKSAAQQIINEYKNRRQKEKDEEENERKSNGFNALMSNFGSLEEGTYTWNGTGWVKQ